MYFSRSLEEVTNSLGIEAGSHPYVIAKVQGQEVQFLFDTGANYTFIDEEEWNKIPRAKRPPLKEPDRTFLLADGSPFKVFGKAYVTIEVEERRICKFPIFVAKLMDPAIMGSNLMAVIKCHWNWSQHRLILEEPDKPEVQDTTDQSQGKKGQEQWRHAPLDPKGAPEGSYGQERKPKRSNRLNKKRRTRNQSQSMTQRDTGIPVHGKLGEAMPWNWSANQKMTNTKMGIKWEEDEPLWDPLSNLEGCLVEEPEELTCCRLQDYSAHVDPIKSGTSPELQWIEEDPQERDQEIQLASSMYWPYCQWTGLYNGEKETTPGASEKRPSEQASLRCSQTAEAKVRTETELLESGGAGNAQEMTLPELLEESSSPAEQASEGCRCPEHLEGLFITSSSGLEPEQKTQLKHLLTSYQHIFSKTDDDIGKTGLEKHQIPSGDAYPIKLPPRRVPLHLR